MDQSKDSPKRLCYRYNDCREDFKDYDSFAAHRKTACPERFKVPSSSAGPSQVRINPAETSSQALESLTDYAASTRTRSCIEALKSTMTEKKCAFEAFVKAGVEIKQATSLFKAAAQQKEKASHTYGEALNRENSLLTITSVQEQLIVSDIRSRALSEYQEALREEQSAATAIRQAICKQKAANEAAVEAISREQVAFIEAVNALRKQKNENSASQTQSENLMHIELALLQSNVLLTELQKEATQQHTSFLALMEAASKSGQLARNENVSDDNVASTSGTRRENLLPDCPQLKEKMDVSTASSDDSASREASDDRAKASTSGSSRKSA